MRVIYLFILCFTDASGRLPGQHRARRPGGRESSGPGAEGGQDTWSRPGRPWDRALHVGAHEQKVKQMQAGQEKICVGRKNKNHRTWTITITSCFWTRLHQRTSFNPVRTNSVNKTHVQQRMFSPFECLNATKVILVTCPECWIHTSKWLAYQEMEPLVSFCNFKKIYFIHIKSISKYIKIFCNLFKYFLCEIT